ncbi:hypothetical protein KL866_10200 [Alteromonas sp. ALT199]|uniref:hypothetical protein n=1 Tax=unclassified Alteromonas TaxID=2614992 RepID=UPI00044665BB|nr:hypothetical protein [Alteromonas sp. ALT199]MBT3135471.1 hypothetical protein [Alteromonas sp. ALT199]
MTNLDKDAVIAAFTEAYEKANEKSPSIESKSGWYSVDGGKNMRLAQLQEMAESLVSGTPKTKEKEKKAAAKPAQKKASTSKKSGFSVKNFWAEKLDAETPGSTLPR